jgi:hypothetical protein
MINHIDVNKSLIKLHLNVDEQNNILDIFLLDFNTDFCKSMILNKRNIIHNKIKYNLNKIHNLKNQMNKLNQEIKKDDIKLKEMNSEKSKLEELLKDNK